MTDYYLAVEIGGTKLQIAIGDENGRICLRKRGTVNREGTAEDILRWMKDHIPGLLDEAATQEMTPVAIGIGFGGPFNSIKQESFRSMVIPGWDSYPVAEWFQTQFSLPARAFNDAARGGYTHGAKSYAHACFDEETGSRQSRKHFLEFAPVRWQ